MSSIIFLIFYTVYICFSLYLVNSFIWSPYFLISCKRQPSYNPTTATSWTPDTSSDDYVSVMLLFLSSSCFANSSPVECTSLSVSAELRTWHYDQNILPNSPARAFNHRSFHLFVYAFISFARMFYLVVNVDLFLIVVTNQNRISCTPPILFDKT